MRRKKTERRMGQTETNLKLQSLNQTELARRRTSSVLDLEHGGRT